jgi:AcrR family transcriptional regulator
MTETGKKRAAGAPSQRPRKRGDGAAPARTQRPGRRAEYAEATRLAIVRAARHLFTSQGYFATKVDEIAVEARVAPATVYAVAGGKQGLLRTLIDDWTLAPEVARAAAELEQSADPNRMIDIIADVMVEMRRDWGDIMRMVIATAPHDAAAAESLTVATKRYRDGYVLLARRLDEIGALKPGVSRRDAVDLLWFYFGYSSLFTLVDDNGWSMTKARNWLVDAARADVLADEFRNP